MNTLQATNPPAKICTKPTGGRKPSNFHTHNGKTLSFREWADAPENIHGLSLETIRCRVTRRKMTIGEALGKAATRPVWQLYEGFGQSLPITQWVRSPHNVHKISFKTLSSRLKTGEPIESALSRPTRPCVRAQYEIDGVSKCLSDWAKAAKMSYERLYDAIHRRGIPLEVALGDRLNRAVPQRDHVVYRLVTANGNQYRTYWQGGSWSMVGEPLRMRAERARKVAEELGGAVEVLAD